MVGKNLPNTQAFHTLLQALCAEHDREVQLLQKEIQQLKGGLEPPGAIIDASDGIKTCIRAPEVASRHGDDDSEEEVLPQAVEVTPPCAVSACLTIPGAPAYDPPPLQPNTGDNLVPCRHTAPPPMSSKCVCLKVTVMSARSLRRADWQYGALSDPYVKVSFDANQENSLMQTRMVAKTLDPVWNHEFIISDFDVDGTLYFNVFDNDWGSEDDNLGNVALPSSRFIPMGFEGELLLDDSGGSLQSYLKVSVAVASADAMSSEMAPLEVWTLQAPEPRGEKAARATHKVMKAKTPKRFVGMEKHQKKSSVKDIFTWSFFKEQLKKLRSPWQTIHATLRCCTALRRPLEPMSSPRVQWDVIGMVVLLIELLWIPMQVYDPPTTAFLEVIGWLTLLYWSTDILATLNTAYIHKQTGNLVKSRRFIAIRYMKSGWFFFDLLLVAVDWATVIQKLVDSGRDVSAGESAAAARAARVSRVFRFIRLLRLMRLAKLRQVMYMIQDFVDSESLMVAFTVCRNIFAILLLNHILACLFYATSVSDTGWVKANGVDHESFAMQYVISLQWSLAQFTPGSPQVQAETFGERTFTVTVLALGMIVATVFVSSITSAMGAAWAANRYNSSQSFLLRQYLQQNRITHGLAARVTRYVDCVLELRQKKIHPNKVHYLDLLSGPLNFELKVELNVPHLVSHIFFVNLYCASHSIMGDICTSALENAIFTKTDKVFGRHTTPRCMSFPTNGTLTYRCLRKRSVLNGRVAKLEPGHWFSEAVLWMPWRHQGQMKAITEVAVLHVNAGKFIELLQQDADAFRCAQQEGFSFIRQAQAQAVFQLPVCDIPLDHLTGRPSGVLLNYYDIRLPRLDGEIREAEDNEVLKVLWQSDSESSSSDSDGDGVKSHGSPGNLKRLHARALTRSVSYCTPAKRLTRSQSDMEKSRSLKDVVRTPHSLHSVPSLHEGIDWAASKSDDSLPQQP
mmetsp:Transcript_56848/g.133552  ORF Transcript_56848/g.133552 Transcript_56848/m.133552 type:complete len:964 (-) Transcript_56848:23-2914(-)